MHTIIQVPTLRDLTEQMTHFPMGYVFVGFSHSKGPFDDSRKTTFTVFFFLQTTVHLWVTHSYDVDDVMIELEIENIAEFLEKQFRGVIIFNGIPLTVDVSKLSPGTLE